MSKAVPGFQIYRSSPKVIDDPPARWVAQSMTWPTRVFLAALACPIVVTLGEQVEFVWSWPDFLLRGRFDGANFLAFLPWVSAAMVIASRFVRAFPAACLCAGSGLLLLATLSFYTSPWIGLFLLAALSVAVGNRVGKIVPDARAVRGLTGIGGLVLLGFGFVSQGRTTIYGGLFSASMWEHAWPVGLLLLGTIGFALAGIAVAIRGAHGLRPCLVSLLSRAVLAGVPLTLLATRFSVPGLGGLNGFDVTAITAGFKVFGVSYMVLVITGLGLASLVARWLGVGPRGGGASLESQDEPTAAPSPEPAIQE